MINIISEHGDFDKIAECAFNTLGLSGEATVELIFMDEEEIRSLNRETRNIDKSTDVLSYPNLDKIMPFTKENYPFDFDEASKAVFLGSIVICEEIAKRQAEEYGHSVIRERSYLFLHGLLHLLGYDHVEEADKNIMRSREEEVLAALGVQR